MKIKTFKYRFLILLVASTCSVIQVYAQEGLEKELNNQDNGHDKVIATFKSTKLINGPTNETLYKYELDFKVDHRFGDIAGSNGGLRRFFGLDNSTDVRIGFDYGVTDKLTVGIARAKGATAVQQLYEGSVKYRLIQQTTDDHIPVAITLFGSNTIAGVQANKDDPTSPIAYNGLKDRMNWVAQMIIARKFTSNFSLILTPSYVHRNFTAFRDQNDLFAIGAGGRLKVTKRMALVVDYFLPFRNKSDEQYLEQVNATKFYNPLGVGVEIETGGHVFHLNFTNATAIQEIQYIPSTTSSWLKGQYRWGFSISRRFSMGPKTKS